MAYQQSLKVFFAVSFAPTRTNTKHDVVSESSRSVQFALCLRMVHFRIEVILGNLQRIVPELTLNFHLVEATALPIGSRSFPKSVKTMILTHGPGDE
jgi:hypothetical protein